MVGLLFAEVGESRSLSPPASFRPDSCRDASATFHNGVSASAVADFTRRLRCRATANVARPRLTAPAPFPPMRIRLQWRGSRRARRWILSSARQRLSFDAVVFELEGVFSPAVSLGADAWKRLFNAYLGQQADQRGQTSVPVEVDPATVALTREMKRAGIGTAVASSSRSCSPLLERAGCDDLFAALVDGPAATRQCPSGKPDPTPFAKGAELLAATAERTVLVAESVSGVRAGRDGRFGLVLGIDRGGGRGGLRSNGADLVVDSLAEMSLDKIDGWFRNREHRRRSALLDLIGLEERIGGRPVAVFLDYDGTVTPVTGRPSEAHLAEETRDLLRRLAGRFPVAMVSGRGREDLEGLVQLSEVYLVGSHGWDISGPAGSGLGYVHDPGLVPLIDRLSAEITEETEAVEGLDLENKAYSIALHYRLADQAVVPGLEAMMDRMAAANPALQKTHGKGLFELRPRADWNKGSGIRWLVEELGRQGPRPAPIFLGDDLTDEDGFLALQEDGVGILVTDSPRPTAAGWSVANVGEALELLELLASGDLAP